MKLSKIPIPNNCYLVEVVTDENNESNHCVYFINEHGDLVDYVKVREANVVEVLSLIHHMMIVHVNSDVIDEFDNIHLVFNRLFDDIRNSEYKPRYDDIFSWQLNEEIVNILRMYSKLRKVYNYAKTTEYKNEKHITSDFCYEHCDEQSYDESINLLDRMKKWVM